MIVCLNADDPSEHMTFSLFQKIANPDVSKQMLKQDLLIQSIDKMKKGFLISQKKKIRFNKVLKSSNTTLRLNRINIKME